MNLFTPDEKKEWLKSLPGKKVTAGVLLFNEIGELLIVKPSYKDHWTIPSGVVEAMESPLAGVKREIIEEIGLSISNHKLLLIDSQQFEVAGLKAEVLYFLFNGGTLSLEQISKIKIDNEEIVEYKFLKPVEAIKKFGTKLSKIMNTICENYDDFVYLENGNLIL